MSTTEKFSSAHMPITAALAGSGKNLTAPLRRGGFEIAYEGMRAVVEVLPTSGSKYSRSSNGRRKLRKKAEIEKWWPLTKARLPEFQRSHAAP